MQGLCENMSAIARLCLAACVGVLLALVLVQPVTAQSIDYAQRQRDLATLSTVFGELHHIRRMCAPRQEADIWRDRMKRLIDFEQPTASLRQNLVSGFNDGYRAAQSRFDRCSGDAEDYAAARAAEGEAVVVRLMEPLYAAARPENDPSVRVWTPAD